MKNIIVLWKKKRLLIYHKRKPGPINEKPGSAVKSMNLFFSAFYIFKSLLCFLRTIKDSKCRVISTLSLFRWLPKNNSARISAAEEKKKLEGRLPVKDHVIDQFFKL